MKVGDRVRIIKNNYEAINDDFIGVTGVIHREKFPGYYVVFLHNPIRGFIYAGCDENELQLIGKGGEQENMVRYELTKRQKANLSADAQALVERGVLSNDLSLADKSWVWRFFMEKFQSEMAKVAREELAEDDAEKEAAKKKAAK